MFFGFDVGVVAAVGVIVAKLALLQFESASSLFAVSDWATAAADNNEEMVAAPVPDTGTEPTASVAVRGMFWLV